MFVSDVLGYQYVMLYDGSFQEGPDDPDLPVSKFHWEQAPNTAP